MPTLPPLIRAVALGGVPDPDNSSSPLNRSASRTFIVVVAPVLNLLGWKLRHPSYWFVPQTGDDADARMVHHLRNASDQIVLAVETRAMGADILGGTEFHLEQCRQAGIPVFAITNGRYWDIYPIGESIRPGGFAARCDVMSDDDEQLRPMEMLRNSASHDQ